MINEQTKLMIIELAKKHTTAEITRLLREQDITNIPRWQIQYYSRLEKYQQNARRRWNKYYYGNVRKDPKKMKKRKLIVQAIQKRNKARE